MTRKVDNTEPRDHKFLNTDERAYDRVLRNTYAKYTPTKYQPGYQHTDHSYKNGHRHTTTMATR